MGIAIEVARVSGAKLRGSFDHIKSSEQTLAGVLDNTIAYAKREKRKILAESKRNRKRLKAAGMLI
jgi:hypothetical protein